MSSQRYTPEFKDEAVNLYPVAIIVIVLAFGANTL